MRRFSIIILLLLRPYFLRSSWCYSRLKLMCLATSEVKSNPWKSDSVLTDAVWQGTIFWPYFIIILLKFYYLLPISDNSGLRLNLASTASYMWSDELELLLLLPPSKNDEALLLMNLEESGPSLSSWFRSCKWRKDLVDFNGLKAIILLKEFNAYFKFIQYSSIFGGYCFLYRNR